MDDFSLNAHFSLQSRIASSVSHKLAQEQLSGSIGFAFEKDDTSCLKLKNMMLPLPSSSKAVGLPPRINLPVGNLLGRGELGLGTISIRSALSCTFMNVKKDAAPGSRTMRWVGLPARRDSPGTICSEITFRGVARPEGCQKIIESLTKKI